MVTTTRTKATSAGAIASRITIFLGAGTVVKVSQLTAVSLTALGIA